MGEDGGRWCSLSLCNTVWVVSAGYLYYSCVKTNNGFNSLMYANRKDVKVSKLALQSPTYS